MTGDRRNPAGERHLPVLDAHHDAGARSEGAACDLACSLSPAGLRERKVLIDRLLAQSATDPVPISGGVQARFGHSPAIERELRALVALEAECCAFLSITVTHRDDLVVLEITGPPAAQSLIDELFTPSRK
jgi:hypothetical protein